jgi:putative hydrolase of the HAD superfamily
MSALAGVRAVLVDVGGPIYPDEPFLTAVVTALDEMLADEGRPPADRDVVRRVYDEVRSRQAGSVRRGLAAEVLGDESRRDELHRRTAPHWTHPPGSVYPDALEALRRLHGHVRTAVVANQEATVVEALRRDGVADLVDVLAVSAIVGVEKPDPGLFRWALEQAGVAPQEAVHVGNRLDNDVRPAKALGLRTVWVLRGEAPDTPTPEQLAEPDVVVRDLTGLPAMILGDGLRDEVAVR